MLSVIHLDSHGIKLKLWFWSRYKIISYLPFSKRKRPPRSIKYCEGCGAVLYGTIPELQPRRFCSKNWSKSLRRKGSKSTNKTRESYGVNIPIHLVGRTFDPKNPPLTPIGLSLSDCLRHPDNENLLEKLKFLKR